MCEDISPNDYLKFIRKQKFCSNCMQEVQIEPSHIKAVGMGRNRKKQLIEHYTAVPMCRPCHIEWHTIGSKAFQSKHHVNIYEVNQIYLMAYLYHKTGIGEVVGYGNIVQYAEA